MGALSFVAAVGGIPKTVFAETAAGGQLVAQAQSETGATRTFAIEGGDLAVALPQFAAQSGLEVVYDGSDLAGLRAAPVRGTYVPAEALRLLLSQTSATFAFTAPATVAVRSPAQAVVPPSAPGPALALDAIKVTGEKVERSYLETYTSTGIVTGDEIETYGLRDLGDAFETMANVRFFPGNRGNNGFQIRGVNADGVTQPANAAPLISVIVDGVTQSAESLKRGSRGLWDAEQVEVLRGPQSTIQGRNALAGAVVVETNDPTYYPELKVKGVAGSNDRREAAVAASGPIIDNQLAFRFSGEFFEEEKDTRIVDSGLDPLNDEEYWSARLKLLFEPEKLDDFRLLLTANRVYDDPGGNAVSGPDFLDRVLTAPSTFSEFREMDVWNYAADASYTFGDVIVRSVTALHDTDLTIEGVPGSPFVREDSRKDKDFTQDLRLEIPEEISGFSGVLGLFYGDFSQDTTSFISSGGLVFQDGTFERGTETFAAYADLRYRVLPWASLIGGLRVQKDKVRNKTDIASAFGPTLYDEEADFTVFLPKFGAAFDLSDTQTIALTATRGYRQGFTEARVGTANDIVEVDPEFVWTYELAYRQKAADGRFVFGGNLFFNDYSDQQVTITDPVFAPLANTRNAAESISYGAEIEGRYYFDGGLQVFGSLGLLKSEFGKFEDTACAPSGGDCDGNEFPEAPRLTAAIGGAYYHHSGFFAAANLQYTDHYFSSGDINNTSLRKLDDRFVANARVGYELGFMSVALYADNLFDEQYLTSIGQGGTEATVGDSREVGVEAMLRF